MAAAHGLACRESAAKSQTASRSWRLTAHRKPWAMRVPDRRVTGATPRQPVIEALAQVARCARARNLTSYPVGEYVPQHRERPLLTGCCVSLT